VAPTARTQEPEELKVPVPLLVNITEPVGDVGLAPVSVTVAVHVVAVLTVIELRAQLTEVVVACGGRGVTFTVTDVGVVVAPRGLPVTWKVMLPLAEEETVKERPLVVPAAVGVTGLTMKDPQVILDGSGVTHDNVTG
jgi:hypothetical protein